jgi:hypothetical protein
MAWLNATGKGGYIGGFLFSKSYRNPAYGSSVEQNGATDLQRIISRGLSAYPTYRKH